MLFCKLNCNRFVLLFKKNLSTFLAIFAVLFSFQSLCSIENSSAKIGTDVSSVIYSEIPEGLEVKKGEYGYGVFATKPFKNGEVIYQNRFIEIGDEEQLFLLKTPQGDFVLNSITHSVAFAEGKRALYTFDSMMNHSCQANSYSETPAELENENGFLQVACRDIAAGEEITCNYVLFEYDCSDKAILNCLCHSEHCYHEVRGFKWLQESQQKELLPKVDKSVLDQYLADHPEIIYIRDLKIPETIKLNGDEENFYLTAARSFKKGDVVYENKTLYFPENKTLFAVWNDIILTIVNKRHTVNRGNGIREFYFFDTYMNHSCDPNTITFYLSPGYYQGVALKDINEGDELTCDYAVFDTDADESEAFECHCGAPNCRKIIR